MCKKDGNWASEWDTSHWIANNEDLADWSVSLFLLFEGFYSSTSLFNTRSSFSFFLFYSLTSHLRTYLIITVVFMASWKKKSPLLACFFLFLLLLIFYAFPFNDNYFHTSHLCDAIHDAILNIYFTYLLFLCYDAKLSL